jgi:hypothetical protein
MKTIIRTTGWILLYWLLIQITYNSGYQKTTDKDYLIDIPEPKPVKDTMDWTPYIHHRDTTKYKGKWVDTN